MLLRENRTLETALRFVALSIGLCALPAFVSRLIDNLAIVARVVHGQPVENRLVWFQASGLTYSAVLCSASVVLFFRPHWFARVLGVPHHHGAIRVGDRRFWMNCVRAAGVSAAVFGAAWLGHAVLRYRGVLPLPAPTDLYVIRGEFVGAMMSVAIGAVWAVSPRSIQGLFGDASKSGDHETSLSDRYFLSQSIRTASIFALAFRVIWSVRFAALLIEEATPWASIRGFAGEVVGIIVAAAVLRNSVKIASALQPNDQCCLNCGVEQATGNTCPECSSEVIANTSESRPLAVEPTAWISGCTRIFAMGLIVWCAATAVARSALLLLLIEGDHPDLRIVVWGIIMGAGAPAIAVAATILFIAPNLSRLLLASNTDCFTRTGCGVIGLVMLAQTLYRLFLPAGYYARTLAGIPGSRFYPSGLVASLQCLSALLAACWFLWRSRRPI